MKKFNRALFETRYRTLRFDLERKQQKEFDDLFSSHQENGTTNTPISFNARAKMRETHYKEMLDIKIQALVDSFDERDFIDESDSKIIESMLSSQEKGLMEYEKEKLQSLLNIYDNKIGSEVIKQNLEALEARLRNINFNAHDLLILAIRNHNKNIKPVEVNSNIFWNKYGKEIVIGLVVTIIGGIILSYIL